MSGLVNKPISRYQAFRNADLREKLAIKYLFFRTPLQYIMIGTQLLLAYFFVTIFDNSRVSEGDIIADISQFQLDMVNQFMQGVRASTVIMFSVFFLYNWSVYKRNGSYGYWLSLGVERSKFLLYSLAQFIYYSLIGAFLGLVLLSTAIGVHIGFFNYVFLAAHILTDMVLITGIGIVLSEIFKLPSVSAIMFILINAVVFLLDESFLFDFLFRIRFTSISIFSILASLVFGMFFNLVAIYLHGRAEFDLR